MAKKKIKNRTKFTIVAIVNITFFTAAVLLLCLKDKAVPDSLIVAFFGAWTAELGLLAGLKLKDKGDNE